MSRFGSPCESILARGLLGCSAGLGAWGVANPEEVLLEGFEDSLLRATAFASRACNRSLARPRDEGREASVGHQPERG